MEIEARVEDRGYALIASFVDGFAAGWKMAVREQFKPALDIKLTPRMYKKQKQTLWTQGKLYGFQEGDTFYDTPLAYQPSWEDALQVLKICAQVTFATSAGYVISESIDTVDQEISIVRQLGQKSRKEETVDGLQIKRQRIDSGLVRFRVYRPNKDRTALEEKEIVECTQDDFVSFLQTGYIRKKDNTLRNLVDG